LMRRAYCRQIPTAAARESFFVAVFPGVFPSGCWTTVRAAIKLETAALMLATSAGWTMYTLPKSVNFATKFNIHARFASSESPM
jgi:hypothetical protein